MIERHTGGAPRDAEVTIIGAGPTGLMLANLLGLQGVRTTVFEAGDQLIDFPRGVGMDDETLRAFQGAGLVDRVLEHTIPDQLLVFVDAKGRDLARLAPPTSEFGWPRRNGFVQPLADRVLLEGLERFPHVDVRWASTVTGLTQHEDGVELDVTTPEGPRRYTADYVVGADGGSSQTRKSLGLTFDGSTAAEHWFVVDIRNDPLGRPGAWVYADPRRPYVSISIPHGIRRFEFMLLPHETDEQADTDAFVQQLIAPLIPSHADVEVIRRRVYTHNSRLASRFRADRAFLIGDAAHVMSVWQGQGYNSGIRDAVNLAWKLGAVVRGTAGEALLDSYDTERRAHARAMIDLSRRVGRAVSVRNRVVAAARNAFFRLIGIVPRIKMYFVTMRFKPMPTVTTGAITLHGTDVRSTPVGRLFIQPTVRTRAATSIRLDDALGYGLALLSWNTDPSAILDDDARARLRAIGARLVVLRPAVQLDWDDEGQRGDDVLIVADVDGSLKRWFDAREESVVLLRPDRIVGGACRPHATSDMVRSFCSAVGAPDPAAPAGQPNDTGAQ